MADPARGFPPKIGSQVDQPRNIAFISDEINEHIAIEYGYRALAYCRRAMPKLHGTSSRRMQSIFGDGYFGLEWLDPWVWYQNAGISPFTMRSLAGKTIPLWIDDPSGEEAAKNPKAKTRVTMGGRRQVLIFRRAANIGARRTRKNLDGTVADLGPASYPGAPGRISKRDPKRPWTPPGRVAGWIAKGNVGVRWRHPGLNGRYFLEYALLRVAREEELDGEIITLEGASPRVTKVA